MSRSGGAQRVLLILAGSALVGVAIFGALVWRAVTIQRADERQALEAFAEARALLGPRPPLLDVDDHSRVIRRESPPDQTPGPIRRMKAVAYQADLQRLVRADVPIWFLKLKGPAAEFALRDTGVDLERLGITPADLERYGPRLIIDHRSRAGSRLLMWTE